MNSSSNPKQRLLKIKHVCEYLSLSPWKVRKLIVDGEIPYVSLGNRTPWLVDLADLDHFIKTRKQTY